MAGITLCTAEAEACLLHGRCYRACAPGGYWQSYSDFSDLIQADGTCPQYWPVQAEPIEYHKAALDVAAFGSGCVFVPHDDPAAAKHIPLRDVKLNP